jgi:hypothetical protein
MRVLLISAIIISPSSSGTYWQNLPNALEEAHRRIWYTTIAEQPKVESPPVVVNPPKPKKVPTPPPPLPKPKVAVTTTVPESVHVDGDRYDRTAQCESGMRQDAVSPDGQYLSYFQWLLSTWHSVGGTGDPRSHSYAEQKTRAKTLGNPSSQWPVCWARAG